MKILFYMIPLAFAFSSFTSQPQELPEMVAPKALITLVEDNEAGISLLKGADSEDEANFHPDWIHQLTKIEESGYHLVLEDGSMWETTWWGHFTSRNWKKGDQIVLIWDTTKTQIKVKNLTQNSFVWASLYDNPKSDASGLKWVQNYTDAYSTLQLNSGTVLHSDYANRFLDWKEGQVVMTLFVKKNKKTTHAIWSPAYDIIIWELEIL